LTVNLDESVLDRHNDPLGSDPGARKFLDQLDEREIQATFFSAIACRPRHAHLLGRRSRPWVMKGATNMMHRVMGVAVVALRVRMQWTQERLASNITKISGRKFGGQRTYMQTISQWERPLESPSLLRRMALGKLAEKHGHSDLAAVFRAAPEEALALVMNLRRPPKQ
jgi:hypothetical protein